MKRDHPTYDELRQDASRKWHGNALIRDARFETMQDMLKHKWRCSTCGTGELTVPICPKCRSARIIEL